MNDSITRRLHRFQSFFDPNGDVRRLLIAYGPADPADRAVFTHRMYWPENKDMHIDWILNAYRDAMRRAEWLDDDFIPHLSLLSGTEIFAECFGCPVHRPEDNMPFALPAIQSVEEFDHLPTPSLFESPLRLQFEMADAVRAQEPDAVMRLPDIQSPLDIAALIWEKRDFYCALVEEPEAVHELCERIYALLTAFLDEWFSRYGYPQIAHYPEYPLFKGLSISEDEIGALSPALFEEYAAPYLDRLSKRYGGIGIHCCANSRHQWANFKKVDGLYFININQPERELEASVQFFSDIAQWPMGDGVDKYVYKNDALNDMRIVESMDMGKLSRQEIIERVAQWREIWG